MPRKPSKPALPRVVTDLNPLLMADGRTNAPCTVRLIAGADGRPAAAIVVRRTALEPLLSQAWQRYDGYSTPADPVMVQTTAALLIDEAADASTAVRMAKRYSHIGQSAQREALALLDPKPVAVQGDDDPATAGTPTVQ